jgi:hypothetical protein
MKFSIHLLFLAFLFFICGCASSGGSMGELKQLNQKPPYPQITVLEPFKWGGVGQMKFSWPKGIYKPVFESSKGFMYEAPSKLVVQDTLTSKLYDGGIFLRNGEQQPHQAYFIAPGNGFLLGAFDAMPVPCLIKEGIKVEVP